MPYQKYQGPPIVVRFAGSILAVLVWQWTIDQVTGTSFIFLEPMDLALTKDISYLH